MFLLFFPPLLSVLCGWGLRMCNGALWLMPGCCSRRMWVGPWLPVVPPPQDRDEGRMCSWPDCPGLKESKRGAETEFLLVERRWFYLNTCFKDKQVCPYDIFHIFIHFVWQISCFLWCVTWLSVVKVVWHLLQSVSILHFLVFLATSFCLIIPFWLHSKLLSMAATWAKYNLHVDIRHTEDVL